MFSQSPGFYSSKLFQLLLNLFINQKCEYLVYSRYRSLRILLLLVLAWVTLLLSNLVLIAVPISLGRALFKAIALFSPTRIKLNGKITVCTIFLHYHACGMEILIFL